MTAATSSTRQRVMAIARRDLRVQLSYQFQLFTTATSLIFSLLTFFFIGKLVGNSPTLAEYEGGYFEFALVGLVVMTFALTALTGFNASISREQSTGTFEILLSGATPLGTLLGGSLIVPLGLAAVQAVVFLGVGWVISAGGLDGLGMLLAVPPLLLTVGSFSAFGILSASFIVLTKRGDPFTGLLLQTTNLLAGAVFPVALLPDVLQTVSHLFPAFYGFNAMRAVLLGGAGFADILDEIGILVAFNLVLFPLAMWVFRRALRMARVTGTLGNA